MNAKATKQNGHDEPSSQSVSKVTQRSRLTRTLLFAGAFALFAMVFVPMPMDHGHGGGYRLIFDKSNTGVAFFQLLVNVAFAALLGAITANVSKRALRAIVPSKRVLRVIATCIALALIGFGVFALVHSAERINGSKASPLPRIANNPFTDLIPSAERYPWKTNIVTTVFWIGQDRGKERAPRVTSAWDVNWTANYGGYDNPDPSARRNYIPIAFVPRQNPFYCALPYNDINDQPTSADFGLFKAEAPQLIPWFKQGYTGQGESVCRNRWVAIRKGNRVCYAEWEDVGPFRTDHFQYVFGNERPTPNPDHGAGLSVSPAVRDYLGLAPTDVTDWEFVEVRDVPPGPWRSYGDNNHFVIARRQSEQRQRK